MGAGIVGYGTKNNTPIDGIQMDLFVKMDLESRMVTKLSYQVHFPVEFSEEQKSLSVKYNELSRKKSDTAKKWCAGFLFLLFCKTFWVSNGLTAANVMVNSFIPGEFTIHHNICYPVWIFRWLCDAAIGANRVEIKDGHICPSADCDS